MPFSSQTAATNAAQLTVDLVLNPAQFVQNLSQISANGFAPVTKAIGSALGGGPGAMAVGGIAGLGVMAAGQAMQLTGLPDYLGKYGLTAGSHMPLIGGAAGFFRQSQAFFKGETSAGQELEDIAGRFAAVRQPLTRQQLENTWKMLEPRGQAIERARLQAQDVAFSKGVGQQATGAYHEAEGKLEGLFQKLFEGFDRFADRLKQAWSHR